MSRVRRTDFLGRRLLIMTAHPDDESYVAAGTMYENRKHGGETFVACATLGEKGRSHLKRIVSDAELKRVRKKELLGVSKYLGVKKVFIFGLPDGQLRFHSGALFIKSFAIANEVKPDFILGFGNDGISGHTDHITISRMAMRVARRLKVPYFAFALHPRVSKSAHRWLKTKRKTGHYQDDIVFEKPGITVPIDSRIKKRALRFHASQMDGRNLFAGFPKYAMRELLRAEHFTEH